MMMTSDDDEFLSTPSTISTSPDNRLIKSETILAPCLPIWSKCGTPGALDSHQIVLFAHRTPQISEELCTHCGAGFYIQNSNSLLLHVQTHVMPIVQNWSNNEWLKKTKAELAQYKQKAAHMSYIHMQELIPRINTLEIIEYQGILAYQIWYLNHTQWQHIDPLSIRGV